jgi:hypothetical protein
MVENQHRQIKGYRDLSAEEIADMNEAKALAETVGDLCKKFEMERPAADKRWLAIARTDLQRGFMSLIRSIARPDTF